MMLDGETLTIGAGDTVVSVPNTFVATVEAISAVGANVDFVDIEKKYYSMDPKKLREYLCSITFSIIFLSVFPSSSMYFIAM